MKKTTIKNVPASRAMTRELDRALNSLVTVLGAKFNKDEYAFTQDVYWEFSSEGGRRHSHVQDHVLASIQYDTKRAAIVFEVEGETLNYKSKPCKTADEVKRTIRMWARGKSSRIAVESTLLAKLARVASQA